jgi:hypothetical protein
MQCRAVGSDLIELPVFPDERLILLREVEEAVEGIEEAHEKHGAYWDRYGPNNPAAMVWLVRARDELAIRDGPWSLGGTREELEGLLTNLRTGARMGMEIGQRPHPIPAMPALNQADPESADERLDIMGVCRVLFERLGEIG